MYRKLIMERMEKRIALSASDVFSDYVDISQLTLEPTYTTFDAPANHVTGTGTPFDGVVELTIQTNLGNFLGTGVLLPTGRHILTAAHNLTDVGTNPMPNVQNVTATFELPGGDVPINVNLGTINVHPDWDRSLAVGNDLTVLELVNQAPIGAQRFDIFRSFTELFSVGDKVGYGQSGQGVVTLPAGVKRDGQNLYEFFFDQTQDILIYDFDNGTAANDTFGLVAGRNNLGLGNQEVMTAPGDSGGPTFIDGRIAGVTSFLFAANGGVGDAVPGLNSSFGEIGGDTRVSVFAPWIDGIIDEVGLPQIMNVSVSGSSSTHTPFSFDTVDGSGLQLRTVPVGGANRVSVQFSEHVTNVTAGSLSLTGLSTHTNPPLAATDGFSYDVGTHTATWTFDSAFVADQYLLSLSDAITDTGGNQLDGDWTNPFSVTTTNTAVSEFPSGNGTAGGDFNFVFTILPGDATLSNTVTGSDFLLWQRNIGGPGHTFTQADYTGDGFTNSADNAFYQANNGTNLRELVFADFDANGIVDGNDLAIWQANANTGTTHAAGDADLDGDVDGNDHLIWSRQLGLELDWVM